MIEDHPIVRDGLRMLIESVDGFTVWGTSPSGEDALDRLLPGGVPLNGDGPGIAVTDVSMPGMSGLDLVAALRVHGTAPPVLVLSTHAPNLFERRVRAAGAQGYVEKSNPGEMIDALRTVAGGGEHWHTPAA